MRISFIAALGLAAGLLAGSALAATTTESSHQHRHHGATAMKRSMHGHHGMMMNEGANAQNGDVDQLNNQSLQAARKRENYNPPGMGGMQGGGMQPAMPNNAMPK